MDPIKSLMSIKARSKRKRRCQQLVASAAGYLQTLMESATSELSDDENDTTNEQEKVLILRKPYTPRTYLWTSSMWSDSSFKRRMRMDKQSFKFLLTFFRASPSFLQCGCLFSRRVTAEVWLAVTIRDLAAGSVLDSICDTFGIPEPNYSSKREQLMQALIEACLAAGNRPMGVPAMDNLEAWDHLANSFARPEYPEFAGDVKACLAGDGTLIGFAPYEKVEHFAKEKWRCRKGFLATNCVFYFDGYRRIIHADIMYEGCSSDQGILNHSRFLDKLPEGYMCLFDAGCSAHKRALVPYQGVRYHLRQWTDVAAQRPQTPKELYNLRHSVLRSSAAECGFGLFKAKWRRFKTQTICKRSVMSAMITAASYLHNFCIDAAYAWETNHIDLFDLHQIHFMKNELASSLRDVAADPNGMQLQADGNDGDGCAAPDTNSKRIREAIATEGWHRYRDALAAKDSFVTEGEPARVNAIASLHETAHHIATATPTAATAE